MQKISKHHIKSFLDSRNVNNLHISESGLAGSVGWQHVLARPDGNLDTDDGLLWPEEVFLAELDPGPRDAVVGRG